MGYEKDFESRFNRDYSALAAKIIRMLSNDSRVSLTEISRRTGVPRSTIANKLRSLRSEFDIRTTLELNENKLGLNSPHLILVKFKRKPDYHKIAKLLQSSYIPQVACTVKGLYDMLIYANATSSTEYAHWDKSMQILLSDYGALWQPSEVVHRQLGFFPLRNEILDRIEMDSRYRAMLKLLNENADMSFQELSRKLGIHFNSIAYMFKQLPKLGYVKRPTITMGLKRGLSFMTIFSKYIPREGYEESSATTRKAIMTDQENTVISRYIISAPLIGSYDFFLFGVYDDSRTAHEFIKFHRELFRKHGIKLLYGEVNEVVLGRLPIRSIDTKKEFDRIVWTPHVEQLPQ